MARIQQRRGLSGLWLAVLVGAFSTLSGACAEPRTEAVSDAEELYAAARWEEAAEAFRSLPEGAADWRPYGAWRAATIYRDNLSDPVKAEEALADCAKTWSAEDWGYVCRVALGDLRRDQENHRGAIDAYRGSLQLRPRGSYSETCLLESGRSYLALGEPEQARLEWKELQENFPTTPLAATVGLEIARSYDIDGRYREALAAYRDVVTRYKGHSVVPDAQFGEGEALEQLGRLEEAIEVFDRLLYTHPNPGAVEVKVKAIRERMERRNTDQTPILGRRGNPLPPEESEDGPETATGPGMAKKKATTTKKKATTTKKKPKKKKKKKKPKKKK